MIRTPRLGCTPGGSCCSACASHLGDTPAADNPNAGLWITLMILGGFALAYGASGKAGRR